MEDTTESRVPAVLSAMLAGLQAGMVGAIWMLAWLGVSAAWQNRGFWSAENLFATAFYGSDAVRGNFGTKTLPGLALYLLLYSLLGCIFALALRGRASSGRLMLIGIILSLGWFYLSFHLIWKSVMPLAYLLSSDRPMVVGHFIFGVCIGRFPAHYSGRREARPATSDMVESAPPDIGEPPKNPESSQEIPLNDPPVAPGTE